MGFHCTFDKKHYLLQWFIKSKLYSNDYHWHAGPETLVYHQPLSTNYDMKTAIMKTKRQDYLPSNTDGGLRTEIFKMN
jgi:hypothetical protein